MLTRVVAEALPKDAGRGLARLDPQDMAALSIRPGDILQVTGARTTAAKAMPTYPEHRNGGILQIDGITRANARASLGEEVIVKRTSPSQGAIVVLSPSSGSTAFGRGSHAGYLSRVLEGLPVTTGDSVRAVLLGSRSQEFFVEETSPDGVVVIGPSTHIRVKGEAAPARDSGKVTYEDIGGLRKELQKIREMIELPLKYPELFERLGIDPPRGVLLHGPPGCGKTLIARAVASETDAAFFPLSGPEVIHKFYGESEAHLRAVFDKAKAQSPAIIFIDEIDAIAAKREEVRGDQQVERRVVAQLLALMDGLTSRGQIIVIGATNLPNVIDPALRRPGRFDREIVISVPDRKGRLEILEIHTRGMPLGSDVRLEKLAEITHGFVGADLEALCREAAMTTLRKIMPRIQLEADYVPYELLSELEVNTEDFMEALREVEPSAIREVFTEVPDVTWDDVGGLEEVKRVLMETVDWPIKYPDLFEQAKTTPPKGILLSGPPGTGKTLLAKAVASQSGANFISVKGPALLSKWVGESEKGVRDVFRKARQTSPCIVFFDEIDALAPARGSVDGSPATDRVISQLLTELDGIEDLRGVMVLAATNRPDLVDPALLRPGRFDLHVVLPAPDRDARRAIFTVHTHEMRLAPDTDLDALVGATDGLVGADIAAICRQAAMAAVREALRDQPEGLEGTTGGLIAIASRHFQEALRRVTGRAP